MPTLSSTSGAELNLRSQLLFLNSTNVNASDLLTSVASWNLRYIHESSHWARLYGSSFGVFLSLLRRTRDLLAGHTLSRLDGQDIGRFHRDRLAGIPLFDYWDERPLERLGRTLSETRQDWLDLHFTYQLLLEPAYLADSLTQWPPKEAVESACNIVWHQSDGAGMLQRPSGRSGIVEISDNVALVDSGEGLLSTRLLFECAGVLDELFQSVGTLYQAADPAIMEMLGHALDNEYGVPYRFAERVAGRKLDPITVLTLIDFAINPVIPGLHSKEASVTWREMYPPLRFAEAVRQLRYWKIEELVSWPTVDMVHTLHDQIATRTGIRFGGVQSRPPTELTVKACATRPMHYAQRIPELTLLYSSKLFEDRRQRPHLLSHFGLNFMDSGALRHVDPDQRPWWLFAPLQVTRGEYRWPSDRINIDEATTFLIAMAVSSAFDDIVHATGPLSVSHLPSLEFENDGELDLLNAELRRATRFPLSWDDPKRR